VDGAEHTPGNTWGHLQTDPVQLTANTDHECEAGLLQHAVYF
jgi:hypothetical protein